jgi:hypothetical protein
MFEQYYSIRYVFRYAGGTYYHTKYKRLETEQEANQFKFWLLHNDEIEVVEYEKSFVEKWIKKS